MKPDDMVGSAMKGIQTAIEKSYEKKLISIFKHFKVML